MKSDLNIKESKGIIKIISYFANVITHNMIFLMTV